MKATDRQKSLGNLIRSQVHFWVNCNDINSPTLYCDNSESVEIFVEESNLSKEDKEDLNNFLDNLLNFIKEKQ